MRASRAASTRWQPPTPNAELVAEGRGLARGLQFADGETAGRVTAGCFERGLLVETSGPDDEVLKLLPALTITNDELDRGLDIIADATSAALAA